MEHPLDVFGASCPDSIDDMDLRVGDEVVGVVKATNVIVEIPSSKEPRS